ncbi:MAG TPA: ribonuclease domain-containing protein [Burkholderiales bacterium]|nr:ribonuclease domain-containing protein [Burkholderiales bacterium]
MTMLLNALPRPYCGMFRKLRHLAAALMLALAATTSCGDEAREAGMPEIGVAELPAQARDTLALIRKGGPFPYSRDGTTFFNREGRLPAAGRGYYREYTVPTPGERTRGARRIVAGRGGELYYTADHYQSFKRIRE